MNKKIKKLQKAMIDLGITAEYDSFEDGTSEWLEIKARDDKKEIAIEIDIKGQIDIGVYELIPSDEESHRFIIKP